MAFMSFSSDERLAITDESSDSSSDKQRRPCKKLKTIETDRVASWRLTKLNSLGIFYDSKHSTIEDVFKGVNAKCLEYFVEDFHQKSLKLKNITNTLVENFNELLKRLSYSLADLTATDIPMKIEACREMIKTIGEHMEKLPCERYLAKFYGRLEDFLYYMIRFLRHIQNEFEDGKFILEDRGKFVQLFMYFTRCMMLDPENGETERRYVTIRGVNTTSSPDFHLFGQGCAAKDNPKPSVLVTVPDEMKRIDMKGTCTAEFKIRDSLSLQTMGQHGGELLLQYPFSAFHPCVLGIICLQTQLIFTSMELSHHHFREIQKASSDITATDRKPHILYTRPYDFMIKEDREEIMGHLFEIGMLAEV